MPRDLSPLLDAAVAGVGGVRRRGQVVMAEAVQNAVETGEHLLVQAGTGTGKSLAYLVPAVVHAMDRGRPAIVSTATLALQAQIVDRDMPRLAAALAPVLGRPPTYTLVKGRRNYLCVHKLSGGYPDDEGALLGVGAVDASASRLGAEITRLRGWAEQTGSGDRDSLVPGVSERAWRQVSVSARECLGSRCPMVAECFVERARAGAADADVVVTNHAFMSIDAMEGRHLLPHHDLLIVDEAHELVDRVTSTITEELTPAMVAGAARRAGRLADTTALAEAADVLEQVMGTVAEGRIRALPEALAATLAAVHAATRALTSELKPASGGGGATDEVNDGNRAVARAAVEEIRSVTERLLEGRELDVAWAAADPRRGAVIRVAPMSVAMVLRDKLFGERTVVMTSATLELGGTFDAVAGTLGLRGDGAPAWSGLDVGSPFDYSRQGIVYVAAHLPAPGRDGLSPVLLDEIEALVTAAGGRTLGLFSSMRAAQAATEELRERLPELEILCQGEDQTGTLVRRFARNAATCLFGTLSLWQGVDVPGSACQLVLIDRIPFPRPDDPLSSARTEAIGRRGGNGFMAVSATHAALRLAQGSGRLIRRAQDRGVVAILDSRMVTARYAGFLQASLPPFWPTTQRHLVLDALRRLDASAEPVLPVTEPGDRVPGAPREPAALASEAVGSGAPVAPSSRTAVTAGTAWTEEADEELRDGAALGMSAAEVADHLDAELNSVVARARTLGLDLGPEQPFSFD